MKKDKQYCPKCGADFCDIINIIEIETPEDEKHYHFRCAKCGNEVVLTKKKEKKK